MDAAGLALHSFGWNDHVAQGWTSHVAVGREAARVVAEDRGSYLVRSAAGERRASVTGRFMFDAGDDGSAYPAVGDWVAVEIRPEGASVHAVLPRRTSILRHAPGKRTIAQVIAANVDIVFVVASANRDLNLRRLERYLGVAWESGAEPAVVLSKADLAEDLERVIADVEAVAIGAAVLAVSAVDGRGLDLVRDRIGPTTTVAFIGSSGVGKSTLLNVLAGEELAAVSAIREDDARGRHTTSRRQLHPLPGGGLVLDTPGMRELALWDADDGLDRSFGDLETLAARCRFSNCGHAAEPGCAITAAIVAGTLDEARLASWRKLEREARHLERRVDALARAEERRKWKNIGKAVGRHLEMKYGRDDR